MAAEEIQYHIVLVHPVIPQNTGSIARLCACTGAKLHLVHPLGFKTDDRSLKRAGLDYWEFVEIEEHESWEAFEKKAEPSNMILLSRFATKNYLNFEFRPPVFIVLGSETSGLPQEIKDRFAENLYKVPIRTHLVRSLNLAQCASIVLFEALRSTGSMAQDSQNVRGIDFDASVESHG